MQRPMPPLRALVAFEAAVRHLSFKQAAEELHITPGAVSQQVRKLEQWLGFPLFLRQTRQLLLTDKGEQYFHRIQPALEQISQISQACRSPSNQSVRLSLSTSLAAKWLAPRMSDFLIQHPHIDIHINATNHPVDFQRENIDLAIRYFDGNDANLIAQQVFADEVLLLCTPEYQDRLQLTSPNQLAKATLLHVSLYKRWEDWLDRFSQLSQSQREKMTSLHFDQTLLGIEAAKRNQGVVLGNRLLVQEELDQGQLIEPFDFRLPSDKNYFVVHPRAFPLSTAAQLFKEWLLVQFELTAKSACHQD